MCSLSTPRTAGATSTATRGALIVFILSCSKNVPRDPSLSPERHTHTSEFLFNTSVWTFILNALNRIKLTTASRHPALVPMSINGSVISSPTTEASLLLIPRRCKCNLGIAHASSASLHSHCQHPDGSLHLLPAVLLVELTGAATTSLSSVILQAIAL